MQETSSLELAEFAASASSLSVRAEGMLERLRRLVPFDAAWLASADPMSSGYTSLAHTDLDNGPVNYLAAPKTAGYIEVTKATGAPPPTSLSALPYPAEDLPTWAECLLPA